VLRELLATFIHTLMSTEPTRCAGPVTTDAAVNGPISATGIGIVSSTRTQAVWIWLYLVRHGSYFPDWLVDPLGSISAQLRQRSRRAYAEFVG